MAQPGELAIDLQMTATNLALKGGKVFLDDRAPECVYTCMLSVVHEFTRTRSTKSLFHSMTLARCLNGVDCLSEYA